MLARLRPFWRDGIALLFAVRDRRTPAAARVWAIAALLYAISPVDLLPDTIPLAGWGDDLLMVPTLLALAARTLPEPVLETARRRSAGFQQRLPWLLPLLGLLALALLIALGWGLWQLFTPG